MYQLVQHCEHNNQAANMTELLLELYQLYTCTLIH